MRQFHCREVILDYLDRYLDAGLDADIAAEFERHLTLCPACVAYLRTYTKTRELVGRTAEVEMPPEMQTLLRRYVLDKLRQDRA